MIFSIDVTKWKIGEMNKWTASVKTGDFATLNLLLSKAVATWDFKVDEKSPDPKDPNSYDLLDPKEWKVLVAATTTEMGKLFSD